MSVVPILLIILLANKAQGFPHANSEASLVIGTCSQGDLLLVKDTLRIAAKQSLIKFGYAVSNAVTCLEIWSGRSVHAAVVVYYGNDLITGKIMDVEKLNKTSQSTAPVEIHINIFGLQRTAFGAQDYNNTLQQNWHYNGTLHTPSNVDNNHIIRTRDIETTNNDNYDDATTPHNFEYLETDEYGNYEDDGDDADDGELDEEEENDNEEDYDFDQLLDKILELGQRQNNDYLLYETYQSAPVQHASTMPQTAIPNATVTPMPVAITNLTVVFYYIDSNFITCVKFIIYDHYVNNQPSSWDYISPVAEYTHLSPHSLKAIITDHQTDVLYVQMQIYGYQPKDLPVDYLGFMPNIAMSTIRGGGDIGVGPEKPMSPLNKLRILMKGQEEQEKEQLVEHFQGHNKLGQTTIADDNNGLCGEHSVASVATNTRTYHFHTFNCIFLLILEIFRQLY